MYDAERINLCDYILSGEGANGQSFDNKADSKQMDAGNMLGAVTVLENTGLQ